MVGCLYISEFPAWALCLQRPDKPAIAVHHDGRIVARSRFLKQRGLLLGDPVQRARVLFPTASFYARDAPFEQAVWEDVLRQIHGVTPYLQSSLCGVAFFKPGDTSEAFLLANRLAAAVGLAPNKSVARIAAARCAQGSVLHIRAGSVSRFFSQTRVSVLSGLGFNEEIASRLELFGLATLDMIASLTKRHLQVQFGDQGLALFDLLHPSDETGHVPVYSPRAIITAAFAPDFPVRNFTRLSLCLGRLVQRAALRLGPLCCSHISLRLRPVNSARAPRLVHRAFKTPTSDTGLIGRTAEFLLREALHTPFDFSALELSLGGLEAPLRVQKSLFFERPSLDAVLARLNERFPGAIKRALIARLDAPFPEESVRFVPFSEQVLPIQ